MRSNTLLSTTPDELYTQDDVALIQGARTDPTAFGELYKRHLARIYGYMRARVICDEEAADLTSQVFLKAWNAFPRYQERGIPFVAWLFRIARNVLTDQHRRRRDTSSWEGLPETLHPLDSEGPEALVLQREARARIQTLVASLDPAKQELLLLRFVANLTLREIACVVGKSEAAVYKQLMNTLAVLKERSHAE